MERTYEIDLTPTPGAAEHPPHGFDQYAYALAAACDELEEAGAHARAQRAPDATRWTVEIHTPRTTKPDLTIPLPCAPGGWFPGASAGHRLIEHGWIVRSCAHFAPDRTAAGWKQHPHHPDVWTAPIAPDPNTSDAT